MTMAIEVVYRQHSIRVGTMPIPNDAPGKASISLSTPKHIIEKRKYIYYVYN